MWREYASHAIIPIHSMKPRIKRTAAAVSAVLVLLLVVFTLLLFRTPSLSDEIRSAEAPDSSFVQLSGGITEYEVSGPVDGEPIVLVSGFSVPFYCWDPIIAGLNEAGFRVYRYNHYGRGLSDHASSPYGPELFEEQLSEFLDAMDISGAVNLVGLSMGGAISVRFANRHPQRLARLCLISPAGFPIEESFSAKLVKVPVIGDFIFALIGDSVMMKRNRGNLYHFASHPEFQEQFERQFAYRGTGRALLSTLRHMPFTDMAEEYRTLGGRNLPVSLIWGEEDAIIPIAHHKLVRETLPQTVFHPLAGTGHVSVYESPEKVLPIMVDFFSTGDAE